MTCYDTVLRKLQYLNLFVLLEISAVKNRGTLADLLLPCFGSEMGRFLTSVKGELILSHFVSGSTFG